MRLRQTILVALVVVLGVVCPGQGGLQVAVQVLVPLSGPHALRGRAQRLGVELALEETGLQRSRAGLDLHVTVNDSQCDPEVESRLVLDRLMSRDGLVVVVGGACGHVDAGVPEYGPAWLPFAPQLLFDTQTLPSTRVQSHVSINFRPAPTTCLETLTQFVAEQNWHQVALLSQPGEFYQAVSSWLAARLDRQGVNVTHQLGLDNMRHLLNSGVRVIVVLGSQEEQDTFLCHQGATPASRHVWLVPRLANQQEINTNQTDCYKDRNVVTFEITPSLDQTEEYDIFTTKVKFKDESLPVQAHIEAAWAYDAGHALVGALRSGMEAGSVPADRQTFSSWFTDSLKHTSKTGVTGRLSFQSDGLREVMVDIRRTTEEPLGSDVVKEELRFSGVPLGALVVLCSLAGLGVIYAFAVIIFNLVYRQNRLIKLTSPNMNSISCFGAVLGYCSVLVLGLDSARVSITTQGHLQMAGAWLLGLGWTLLYGAVFARTWRVYLVFRNLNFNGKLSRDEHLLLGVLLLLLGDIAILLPWTLTDPVSCSRKLKAPYYEASSVTDVTVVVDECWSQLQGLWVGLLYAYKLLILVLGTYFTFQTRHVTLPSLRDSREMYEVVCTVAVMAVVALPVLTVSDVTHRIKYISGALTTLLTVTMTLSLIHIPKMVLMWREARAGRPDATQFQFSESLRRTQDKAGRCPPSWCCPLASSGDTERYARDMLASEIDTLKRTIKEKDATIRELTDRLYFGPEKVQESEYMTSPRRIHGLFQDMHRKHVTRVRSQPLTPTSREYAQTYDVISDMRDVSRDSPSGSSRASPQGCEGPSKTLASHTQVSLELDAQNLKKHYDDYAPNVVHKPYLHPPPPRVDNLPYMARNHELSRVEPVVDNTSILSIPSEQDSMSEQAQCSDVESDALDVAAIENEATGRVPSWIRHQGALRRMSTGHMHMHHTSSYESDDFEPNNARYRSSVSNISQTVDSRFQLPFSNTHDEVDGVYYPEQRGYLHSGLSGAVI